MILTWKRDWLSPQHWLRKLFVSLLIVTQYLVYCRHEGKNRIKEERKKGGREEHREGRYHTFLSPFTFLLFKRTFSHFFSSNPHDPSHIITLNWLSPSSSWKNSKQQQFGKLCHPFYPSTEGTFPISHLITYELTSLLKNIPSSFAFNLVYWGLLKNTVLTILLSLSYIIKYLPSTKSPVSVYNHVFSPILKYPF